MSNAVPPSPPSTAVRRSTGKYTPEEKALRDEAYCDSRCVDCRTVPYSAGRTRCNECHLAWLVDQQTSMIPAPPIPRERSRPAAA